MTANSNATQTALVVSTAQVSLGALMINRTSYKNSGMILFSSGVSGFYYLYRSSQQFDWRDYGLLSLRGGLSGLCSGALGALSKGASLVSHVFSGAINGGVLEVSAQMIVDGELTDYQAILKKVWQGGVTGMAGGISGEFVGSLLPKAAGLKQGMFAQAATSGASSAGNKIATNWFEGKPFFVDVKEATIMGGAVGAALTWLQSAQFEKLNAEKALEELQADSNRPLEKLKQAQQRVSQAQELLDAFIKKSDQEIQHLIGQGYRAKIGGRFASSQAEIKAAYLQGKLVEWWPSRSNPSPEQSQIRCIQKTPHLANLQRAEQNLLSKQGLVLQFQAHRNPYKDLPAVSLWGVFSEESVSFVDCDLNELIEHVVLVHAIAHAAILKHSDFDNHRIGDPDYVIEFVLQKSFSPDGTFGLHLDLEKRQFSGEFECRPQTHWAWNQLVQPHRGAHRDEWEKAQIVILEPLSAFERSPGNRPYAVSPYDSQVFNPVRLSDRSTILVPDHFVEKLQSYLKEFRGKIIGFDAAMSLRKAVMKALQDHYPKIWHICDSKGNELGDQEHFTNAGFEDETCLKTLDGQVHVLMRKSGERSEDLISRFMKAYRRKEKRWIGLHCNSTTYWLESEVFFDLLKEFKTDRSKVKDHPLCAVHIKGAINSSTVGILKAFEFHQKLQNESIAQTGCCSVANYVLKEAIFADIYSLLFAEYSEKNLELTALDLQMMITPAYSNYKRALNKLQEACHDQNQAREALDEYLALMREQLEKKLAMHLQERGADSLASLFEKQQDWLKLHHLEICDFTRLIGDCLFDNVIAQAEDLVSKTATQLRQDLVKFMEENSSEYASKPEYQERNYLEVAEGGKAVVFNNWNEYLACILQPQVWATELEIQALAAHLQRPIVLISLDAVPKIYNEPGKNKPIFLNHKNWNHYESCRPVNPKTSQEVYNEIKNEAHY